MKTPRTTTRLFAIAVCFLSWMASARAQPVSSSASSVEWLAAKSCVIVRAVIDKVSVHAHPDGLHAPAGIHRYQTVSIRVLETLKGKHADHLQFVEDGDFGSDRLSDLQTRKQELLLFLEPWMLSEKLNRSQGGYAYTRFPLVVHRAMLLTPNNPRWAHTSVPVLSSDLTQLTTPRQTMDAIRSYLKGRKDQRPPRAATTELPPHLRGRFYRAATAIK